MWSTLFWLFALLAIEVAIFALTLWLARTFAHSHDREWAADGPNLGAADQHTTAANASPELRGGPGDGR